jgi:hypothetical protein
MADSTCIVCGATTRPRHEVCADCAVCVCGSGRPPSLCHGEARPGEWEARRGLAAVRAPEGGEPHGE